MNCCIQGCDRLSPQVFAILIGASMLVTSGWNVHTIFRQTQRNGGQFLKQVVCLIPFCKGVTASQSHEQWSMCCNENQIRTWPSFRFLTDMFLQTNNLCFSCLAFKNLWMCAQTMFDCADLLECGPLGYLESSKCFTQKLQKHEVKIYSYKLR